KIMVPHNRAKILVVSLLFIFFQIYSCTLMKKSDKRYTAQNEEEKILRDNCGSYTFNYTKKFEKDDSDVTIYGKTSFCSTGISAPKTKISFFGENDSLLYETRTDQNGNYILPIKAGLYTIKAKSPLVGFSTGSLTIPDVHLGLYGNSMQIDIKLVRSSAFPQEVPLTRQEIKQIKEKSKTHDN